MRLITLLCFLLPLAAQAGLYKCLDNAGRVTYTNAACEKTGLKEGKLIPPPPPPAIDRPQAQLSSVQSPAKLAINKPASAMASKEVAPKEMPATRLALNSATITKTGNCDHLNLQIGRVMDEMDLARPAGYTAKQEADWNQTLSRMQAEKSRLSCF
jgi:hypothetical protein